MRRIVDYEILRNQITHMPRAVRMMIDEDWEPFGPLILQADEDVCFQVIVKYQDPEQ